MKASLTKASQGSDLSKIFDHTLLNKEKTDFNETILKGYKTTEKTETGETNPEIGKITTYLVEDVSGEDKGAGTLTITITKDGKQAEAKLKNGNRYSGPGSLFSIDTPDEKILELLQVKIKENIDDKEKEHHTKLYADAIINGQINKATEKSNEDTVFELTLKTPTTAEITVAPSAYARVLKNPSFLDGTDPQILTGATKVDVEQVGKVEKQADGKRKITQQPRIILR